MCLGQDGAITHARVNSGVDTEEMHMYEGLVCSHVPACALGAMHCARRSNEAGFVYAGTVYASLGCGCVPGVCVCSSTYMCWEGIAWCAGVFMSEGQTSLP